MEDFVFFCQFTLSFYSVTDFTLRNMSQKLYGSGVAGYFIYQRYLSKIPLKNMRFEKKFLISKRPFSVQRKIIDWFPNDESLS